MRGSPRGDSPIWVHQRSRAPGFRARLHSGFRGQHGGKLPHRGARRRSQQFRASLEPLPRHGCPGWIHHFLELLPGQHAPDPRGPLGVDADECARPVRARDPAVHGGVCPRPKNLAAFRQRLNPLGTGSHRTGGAPERVPIRTGCPMQRTGISPVLTSPEAEPLG